MTSAGFVYLCLCALLAALALSGHGAQARALTGPCLPGTFKAGVDLPISILPDLTRTIHVIFAGARPNLAQASSQFCRSEFQQKFIGGKPCGRLHTH
jgi:hypothetical protein